MARLTATIVRLLITIGTLSVLFLQGCSGGGGGSSSTGTLKLAITDRQSDDFRNVVIAIREIRVVPAGRENAIDNDPALPVVASFTPARSIDVMQLRFVQQALGETVLPAGTYSQIRLILEQNPDQGEPVNYLTLNSDPDVKVPLKAPSSPQSGLKILGPVQVQPGVINAVVIDFDPNSAIVARGNAPQNEKYILKPTGIRIVQTENILQQFGSISGIFSSTFKDWSSATVSVRRRGLTNDSDPIASGRIFSSYTSGRWQAPFAAFVPPSGSGISYRTFIASNGFRVYSSPLIQVTQGQTTDLGEIIPPPLP